MEEIDVLKINDDEDDDDDDDDDGDGDGVSCDRSLSRVNIKDYKQRYKHNLLKLQ